MITVGDPEPHLEYGGVKQYYTYTLKGKDSKGMSINTQEKSIFIAVTQNSSHLDILLSKNGLEFVYPPSLRGLNLLTLILNF